MTELGLLARQVDASERTLRRAVSEGTLRGKRLSERRLKLSAAEKEYVLGHWGLLAKLRSTLRTEPNVRFALLFGSAARGDDTETSDVDLLVEMRDTSLARVADLELKLEGVLGREVEVIALEDGQADPLLLAEATREGRVIVDRDRRWPALRADLTGLEQRADAEFRSRRRRAYAAIDRLLAES